MKSIIYYFSGAGNSLAIAKALARELDDTEVYSISKEQACQPLIEGVERFGIVFPVYCQDMPPSVATFIKKISIQGHPYIFGVATHNGEPGYSLFTMQRLLARKGQMLSAGFTVLMPGISQILKDFMNPPEEQTQRLQQSQQRLKEMITVISRNAVHAIEGENTLALRIKGSLMQFTAFRLLRTSSYFSANASCTGCGTCRRICPQNNITIHNKKAAFGNHCDKCLACFHWCPAQAIQLGKNTESKPRYHHPDIALHEMMIRS